MRTKMRMNNLTQYKEDIEEFKSEHTFFTWNVYNNSEWDYQSYTIEKYINPILNYEYKITNPHYNKYVWAYYTHPDHACSHYWTKEQWGDKAKDEAMRHIIDHWSNTFRYRCKSNTTVFLLSHIIENENENGRKHYYSKIFRSPEEHYRYRISKFLKSSDFYVYYSDNAYDEFSNIYHSIRTEEEALQLCMNCWINFKLNEFAK